MKDWFNMNNESSTFFSIASSVFSVSAAIVLIILLMTSCNKANEDPSKYANVLDSCGYQNTAFSDAINDNVTKCKSEVNQNFSKEMTNDAY